MDLQDHDGGARLHAYVRSHQRAIEGQLAEWVRVPGVLGMPEHAKAQVLAHLWGLRARLYQRSLTFDRQSPHALSRLDATSQTLPHSTSPAQAHPVRPAPAVNLKFLVEGEEEGGSANLATLLEEQAERFQSDVVLFSDTLLWRADHPALCMGLRGMLNASLEVLLNGAVTLACFWNELARMHQPKDDGDGHPRQ
jgi:hypothetical protein